MQPQYGRAEVTGYLEQRHGPVFIGDGNKIELSFGNNSWAMVFGDVEFDGETGMEVVQLPLNPTL
ncbi:MAG: hypothetical protein R2759_11370 [Bacteroidales bacterium]